MLNYRIEKATIHDLKSILFLNQNSIPAVSSSNLKMMQKFLYTCYYFKVCKIDGKIIGFLNALLPLKDYKSENYNWFNERYKNFIYVDRIVISTSYQNQGYGTVFYNDLIASIQNDSLDIVCEINTKPYNEQSIQFHTKYGFNEIGKKKLSSNKSVIYMKKTLNED